MDPGTTRTQDPPDAAAAAPAAIAAALVDSFSLH